MDGTSEETFGPLAILAAGLIEAEYAALRALLDEIGAHEVKLLPYTAQMASKTLGEVLEITDIPNHVEPFEGSRPVAFLSGMYASEVIEVVTEMRCAENLPSMAFAAAVPNNWSRQVHDLISDVYADHEAVAAMREQRERENWNQS